MAKTCFKTIQLYSTQIKSVTKLSCEVQGLAIMCLSKS